MCRQIENATKAAHEAEEDARRHVDRLTQLNESLTDECQRVEAELADANAMQRKSQSSINEVARLTALVCFLLLLLLNLLLPPSQPCLPRPASLGVPPAVLISPTPHLS
jgi:hypothetical protein